MDKENEDSSRNQKITELLRIHKELDDTCVEIFFTLMAYKRLRFNELHRRLKMFGTDITKPSLLEHLDHLKKRKLINRKNEGFQNVTYGLTNEIDNLLTIPEEDIKKWVDSFIKEMDLDAKKLGLKPFDEKEYFAKLSKERLDELIDKDLDWILAQNLFELRTFIIHDLRLDKTENDAEFWNFVGNPLYRMLEKNIVEKCRTSEEYHKELLWKMDVRMAQLRPDRKPPTQTKE